MLLVKIIKHSLFMAIIMLGGLLATANIASAQSKPTITSSPQGPIILDVTGKINNPNEGNSAVFDLAMLKELPAHTLKTSTLVTEGVHSFTGFLMRDLLEYVQAYGKTLAAKALNDYEVNIDLSDFNDFEVIVAYEMDGAELQTSDKGPLWIIYPRDDYRKLQDIRYDYRWVWQLYELEIK